MHILISNDDGYLAPGLQILAEAAAEFAKITIVAPDRNRSAASNSLTLRRPLYVHSHAENQFHIEDGTPSDCVHMALTGILDEKPDMVISGINHGANLGDDVIYSGTVAAAMEGRHLGYPAIAFSMNAFEPEHWETAAKSVKAVLAKVMVQELPIDSILNVNIPDIPWEEVGGFRATRLGQRHPSEDAIKYIDPRGNDMFWVGPVGKVEDSGDGSDFDAIERGYISVTPLSIDLTRHSQLESLRQWMPAVH